MPVKSLNRRTAINMPQYKLIGFFYLALNRSTEFLLVNKFISIFTLE